MGTARGNGRSVVAAAFVGALMAVALIPSARSTVTAQVVMALGQRPEWARAATGGSWARLERAAAADPHDIELQVGLVTLPPSEPGFEGSVEGGTGMSRSEYAGLIERLKALALRFPGDPGIRAHLLRHLTRGAVQIDRPELADFERLAGTAARHRPRQKPSPEALAVFLTAATEGARLEPNNAFFDAMRAAGEFADTRDAAALRDLHAAAKKPDWDDHATEETQAQWKLLDLAYGDHGIVQKSPGFEHLLLPHFEPLRVAAHLAVWHAAADERAGDRATGRAIRHDLMQLGMTMAGASPLIVGKSVGLGIFQIGTSPVPPDPPLSAPSRTALDAAKRERQQWYERSLQVRGEMAEADWARTEREKGDAIQNQIQRAITSWRDLEPPSTPEGWAGWWTFGILLLAQIAVLLAIWGGSALLARLRAPAPADAPTAAASGWAALAMALLVTTYVVIAVTPIFGLSWHDLDDGIVLRLFAGLVVFLAASKFWPRGGSTAAGAAGKQTTLLWIAAFLAVCLVPTVLWTATGSIGLLRGSLLSGIASMSVLAVARRSGRRGVGTDTQPSWKPALVAFLCVLPGVVLSFMGREVLSSSNSFTARLLALHSTTWDGYPSAGPWSFLGALLVLPGALLLLFQLLRVVALQQSVRLGMARGLRQTASAAVVMLLAVYLAALVPTIARDRAAERQLERMLSDQMHYSPNAR